MHFLKRSTDGRCDAERERSANRAVGAAVLAGGFAFSVSMFPLPGDDARLLDLLSPENELSQLVAPYGKTIVEETVAVASTIELPDLVKLTEVVESSFRNLPAFVLPALVKAHGLPEAVRILQLVATNSALPEAFFALPIPGPGGGPGGGGGGMPAAPTNAQQQLVLLLELLAGRLPANPDFGVWELINYGSVGDRITFVLSRVGQALDLVRPRIPSPAALPTMTMTQRIDVAPSPPPPPPSQPAVWSPPPAAPPSELPQYTSIPSAPPQIASYTPDTGTLPPPNPDPTQSNSPDPTPSNSSEPSGSNPAPGADDQYQQGNDGPGGSDDGSEPGSHGGSPSDTDTDSGNDNQGGPGNDADGDSSDNSGADPSGG